MRIGSPDVYVVDCITHRFAPALIFGESIPCPTLWTIPDLTPADEGHRRCHHSHKLDVGFQGQAGHVDHRIGDVLYVHRGLADDVSVGLRNPRLMTPVISVSALPISIWPQAMLYLRPSREAERVRPVIACFVAV